MKQERGKKEELRSLFLLNSSPQPTLDELVDGNPGYAVFNLTENYRKKIVDLRNKASCTVWVDDYNRPIRIENNMDEEVDTYVYDEEGYLIEEETFDGDITVGIKKYFYTKREGEFKELLRYESFKYDLEGNQVSDDVVDFDNKGNPIL